MQGLKENVLKSTDKLVGFQKQITLWKNKVEGSHLEKFQKMLIKVFIKLLLTISQH